MSVLASHTLHSEGVPGLRDWVVVSELGETIATQGKSQNYLELELELEVYPSPLVAIAMPLVLCYLFLLI